MYVFWYGSMLDDDLTRELCPKRRKVGLAALPNAEVHFPWYWESDKGGGASLIDAPGKMIWGVLWDLSDAEVEAIDTLGMIGQLLYVREQYLLMREPEKEWVTAWLYRHAFSCFIRPEQIPFPPSGEYLRHMIKGAREHELPQDYIQRFADLLKKVG